MNALIIVVVVVVAIVTTLTSLFIYYKPYIDIVEDVNLNPVVILWYNYHTSDGEIIRKHKILYDKR